MITFPEWLNPSSYSELRKEALIKRQAAYLRRHILEQMLSSDFKIPDNCSISLQQVPMGEIECFAALPEAVEIISKELKSLGWNTEIGFGGQAIWIWSGNTKPRDLVSVQMF